MENEELLAHMTKATIAKGDKLLIKFDVEKTGCILRYLVYKPPKGDDLDTADGIPPWTLSLSDDVKSISQ